MANVPSVKLSSPKAEPPRRPLQRQSREPELFAQLLPFLWRFINVPYSSLRVTLDHSLVEHKYFGVDGVNVEATGLNGLVFEATIPLFNSMSAGPSETWGGTRPFPELFQVLWSSFYDDRSTGPLQHPLFGVFTCKPRQLVFPLEANKRNGSEITASWLETTDFVDDGSASQREGAAIAAAKWAAINLDASLEDLRGKVPQVELPALSFEGMLDQISGAFDSLALSAQLMANKPAQFMSHVNLLQSSFERMRNAQTWPVIDACERLREAVQKMAASSAGTRKTTRYVVKAKTTLPMLANTLKASVDDLVKLNPNLLRQLDVFEGTVVRYYG